MPKAHPLFLDVASALRALACAEHTLSLGSVVGSNGLTHAEEEMIEAKLSYADLVYTLQNGKITHGELFGDVMRYQVEEVFDGVHAGFIVEFSTEEKWIEIVTAFRVNE